MLNLHRYNITNFAKLIVALALLIGIVVVAAQDLAPNITYAKLFAYIFIGLFDAVSLELMFSWFCLAVARVSDLGFTLTKA